MGPSHRPLLGLTVGGAIDRAANLFGDTEAIVSRHQNIRKTFSQVKEEVGIAIIIEVVCQNVNYRGGLSHIPFRPLPGRVVPLPTRMVLGWVCPTLVAIL